MLISIYPRWFCLWVVIQGRHQKKNPKIRIEKVGGIKKKTQHFGVFFWCHLEKVIGEENEQVRDLALKNPPEMGLRLKVTFLITRQDV